MYSGFAGVGARTAKKFSLPSWSVDNSPPIWRGSYGHEDIAVVGASRNRNFRDNLLESGTQIRKINSGIYETLIESVSAQFIALEGSVPEIYTEKNLHGVTKKNEQNRNS